MKKYFFPLIVLGVLVLSPQKLMSEKFSIKLGMGLSYGGRVHDIWTNSTDYFIQGTKKDVKKFSAVQEFIEIVFPVYQNFSLSVGAGHFSKILRGTEGIYTMPDSSDVTGDFFSAPEFHFQSFPVFVTAAWTYHVWAETHVYVFGGMGYYFSKFNIYNHDITYNLQGSSSTLNYFPLDYHGRTGSMGYSGGVGFDVSMGQNFYFFIESVYRQVTFKKFESNFAIDKESAAYALVKDKLGESVAESTFLYFINLGGKKIWGDIFYSIDNIFLSEIIFQAGLKIRF